MLVIYILGISWQSLVGFVFGMSRQCLVKCLLQMLRQSLFKCVLGVSRQSLFNCVFRMSRQSLFWCVLWMSRPSLVKCILGNVTTIFGQSGVSCQLDLQSVLRMFRQSLVNYGLIMFFCVLRLMIMVCWFCCSGLMFVLINM